MPLLEDYLDEQAHRLHQRCGEVAGAAVTLAVDGRPATIGSSTPLAYRVDQTQYEVGVGPCLTALTENVALYVPDLANDSRWAPYGPKAAALGALSCVSVPVVGDHRPIAVVKVYSGDVDGLDERQRAAAEVAAVEITGGIGLARILVQQAEELDDRVAAMNSRRTIDMAIGMLMERVGCDADTAFGMLRQQSQNTNVKLRDTASALLGGRRDDAAPFDVRRG